MLILVLIELVKNGIIYNINKEMYYICLHMKTVNRESNTNVTKIISIIDISFVSVAYKDKKKRNTASYDDNYKCIKCQEGCDSCVDSSPCLATYHWGLR